MNVNSLLEGASPYQNQQAESAKLSAKWEKSGLLEGLDNHETEKTNMAVLLENQARQLVNEANSLGASGAGTSITAGGSEAWAGVALPLVRRVFGEIVAKDLVSVQPMNLPSGLIFYLDFQYGQNAPGFTENNSLYAASADQKKTELPAVGSGKGLCGAGRFGYSINEFNSAFLHISGGAAGAADDTAGLGRVSATTASFGSLLLTDSASVNFDGEFLAANTLTDLDKVIVASASLADFDPEGI